MGITADAPLPRKPLLTRKAFKRSRERGFIMPCLHSLRLLHPLPNRSGLARFGFLLLLLGTVMWAQTTTADILGTVTDATGGVLPGLKITVHNLDTGANYLATSDAAGNYTVTLLPIGRYSMKVTNPGFKTWTVQIGRAHV